MDLGHSHLLCLQICLIASKMLQSQARPNLDKFKAKTEWWHSRINIRCRSVVAGYYLNAP